MVHQVSGTHTVKKGDCAWNVARQNLQVKGQKVSNTAITTEMKRLANLNGCDSVDDFNKKFFSSIGLSFKTEENTEPKTPPRALPKPVNVPTPRTPSAVRDSVGGDSTIARVDSTRVVTDTIAIPKKVPVNPKQLSVEAEVQQINNMKSDERRIIEYNKNHYNGKYYGIVDKETCQLKIYDKSGKVVKSFIIGVGKSKGDSLPRYYMDHYNKTENAARAESNRFTAPGEFTLDETRSASDAYTGKDGKPKIMTLRGDNRGEGSARTAIHMLYKPAYKTREAAIDSPGLEDNRMSYGCVNLKEEDYDVMHQYLGEGDKIFILPEEKGNKLQLEKQKDGTYKFEQQYHKDQKRSISKEVASTVNYDVRPDKNPEYIRKQQAQRKAEQQRLLAEQQRQEQYSWYDPRGWFS